MSLRLISLLIPSLVGRLDTYPFRRVTQHSGPAAEYERLVRRDFVSQYRINAKKVGGFLKGPDPLSRHQRSEHRKRPADCPPKGGVELGKATGREREWQSVWISVVDVPLKK